MTRSETTRTGGELIVDVLERQGADRIFGVPGESFLAVLDALVGRDTIAYVTTRHEGAAAMMADADGKLTGRPGIAMVTRGPGATNAAAGVHVAHQDSTPMILFVGLIGRSETEREAFQEIDLKAVFGSMAKWVATITDAARIPELVTRAFATAMAGRPGPVVIGLPEDMLVDRIPAPALPARCEPVHGAPSAGQIAAIASALAHARRPMVIAGGETWTPAAVADLSRFAAAWSLPVACSFRAQDRMSARDPAYAGDAGLGINPALASRIRDADLLLVLGARLGDCTTQGYTLLDLPMPSQTLIHIHPSAEEPGRVFAPSLGIAAGMPPTLAALAATAPAGPVAWQDHQAAAHRDYRDWTIPTHSAGPLNLGSVMAHLRETLPDDAILCNGAGNYAIWLHRFYHYRAYRTQLAPTSGSMGYGLPASIAAKLRHPDRPVICLAGDGCLQMSVAELATLRQTGAAVIVLVINNGMYGTIRMHQERSYPGRVSATALANPDFPALAAACGIAAERVTDTAAFAPAFARAMAANAPRLIELIQDPRDITPRQTLADLRATP